MPLTTLESSILQHIQQQFPLSADPYADIGAAVGISREEAHAVVQRLRQRGIIRRIGGSFAASKLGYSSTLVAARVAPEHIAEVAALAGSFREVTHNYQRQGLYNLWFTIIAETPARVDEIVGTIRRAPYVQAAHSLPALRTFKIQVHFQFAGEQRDG